MFIRLFLILFFLFPSIAFAKAAAVLIPGVIQLQCDPLTFPTSVSGGPAKLCTRNVAPFDLLVSNDGGPYIPVGGGTASFTHAIESTMETIAEGSVNNHIKFDTVFQTDGGGEVLMDIATPYVTTLGVASLGRVTLAAGSTYNLTATIPYSSFSLSTGQMDLVWRNADTGTLLGETVVVSSTVPHATVFGTISTAVATRVEVLMSGVISNVTLGIGTEYNPILFIEKNTSGAGGGGSGTETPSAVPRATAMYYYFEDIIPSSFISTGSNVFEPMSIPMSLTVHSCIVGDVMDISAIINRVQHAIPEKPTFFQLRITQPDASVFIHPSEFSLGGTDGFAFKQLNAEWSFPCTQEGVHTLDIFWMSPDQGAQQASDTNGYGSRSLKARLHYWTGNLN